MTLKQALKGGRFNRDKRFVCGIIYINKKYFYNTDNQLNIL